MPASCPAPHGACRQENRCIYVSIKTVAKLSSSINKSAELLEYDPNHCSIHHFAKTNYDVKKILSRLVVFLCRARPSSRCRTPPGAVLKFLSPERACRSKGRGLGQIQKNAASPNPLRSRIRPWRSAAQAPAITEVPRPQALRLRRRKARLLRPRKTMPVGSGTGEDSLKLS